jgi:hypothetical protein
VFCFEKSNTSKNIWIPAFAGITKLSVLLRLFPHRKTLFQPACYDFGDSRFSRILAALPTLWRR